MEVGYYLTKQEISDLLKGFEANKKFQNLISEMNKLVDFNLDTKVALSVEDHLKFDAAVKGRIVTAKSLVLKVKENVFIQFFTRYFDGKKEEEDSFFVGTIINQDSETRFTQHVLQAADETVVSLLESEYEKEAVDALNVEEENQRFEQEFNFDENYRPGQLLEENVETQEIRGCIAGGYLYCGADCGGYPACAGSRSGVNELDNCCKTHDCCYHYRGVKYPNCYCDYRLCNCSRRAPWTGNKAKVLVEAAFCNVC
jgi:hypothetical protein